jgi:hypothetical protein
MCVLLKRNWKSSNENGTAGKNEGQHRKLGRLKIRAPQLGFNKGIELDFHLWSPIA